MGLADFHRRAVEHFDRHVSNVSDDQWDAPTPCTDWSVRDLVNHVVNENMWTPDLLSGKTIEEVGDRYDGDLLGADPKGVWASSASGATSAVGGVADFGSMVNVSWGQIPAQMYVEQLSMDHLIHGWDLAKAIGGDTNLDEELVEFCYAIAKAQEELIRGSGVFGDSVEVPDDANTQTRLLAILGREG